MARKYHTLVVNDGTAEAPAWGPQFGDYYKTCVEAERDEYRRDYPASSLKIITTGDTQADIASAVAKLNDWRAGGQG
jgi:hypothetical protein